MSAKLYEYAIIWHPTEQQAEDGQSSRIIQAPEVCLATNEKIVAIKAARSIPDEFVEQLDQVEVAIRPF